MNGVNNIPCAKRNGWFKKIYQIVKIDKIDSASGSGKILMSNLIYVGTIRFFI